MSQASTGRRPTSFLVGRPFSRLAAKVAPLVQTELAGALIAELERHFNEQVLSELQNQVAGIIDRELAKRPESGANGVTADEITACIEMILGRTPDPSLVEYHLKMGFANRFELGQYMINTHEFRTRFSGRTGHDSGTAQRSSIFLGDRVLTVNHRGQAIYLAPLDLDLTPSILLHGKWEPHIEDTVVTLLRPGNTVIDVGANVGYHTLAMATAVGATGQVHAFEANPDVMRLLKATMFVNGLVWVILYETAALDQPGTVTLATAPDHYGWGHVITNMPSSDYGSAYSTRVDVPAVTLDAALADRVGIVDLIHMDIEGSEPLALRGAQRLIDRSPNIKIVSEWSVRMMNDRGDTGQYVAWLMERGFRFWLIEAGAKLASIDPSALFTLPHCDLLLSREDPR